VLEIARGVYAETGYEGGNVGVVLTARGTLLVDTPMLPYDARAWKWSLQQLGISEHYYGIVNTDYHPEHVLGNAAFMPVRIWGHELALKQLAKYKSSLLEQLANAYREENPELADEIAQVEVHLPEICVGDRVTLHLDVRPVEILYLNGHTPASLGVYLPQDRILFAGDNIVCRQHPVMAQANSAAWIETLHRLDAMDINTIVPGEGQLCGKGAIGPLIEYITEMRERVTELFQNGASRRECVDRVGLLDHFDFAEEQSPRMKRRRRENVERVYAEVRSAQSKR
jgi:cyclase